MRAFSVFGAIASASDVFGVSNIQCDRHVEMLILQDATSSYATIGEDVSPKLEEMVKKINDRMGEALTAVALFCDKPSPFRGLGEGRGAAGVIDMCYNNDFTVPLSSGTKAIADVYNHIYDLNCQGGDYPESSLEALMYAAMDPKINWSAPEQVYTSDMKRIVKVIVLVTDDHPHYAGDALAGVKSWNPLPAGQKDGYPHFFDKTFYNLNGIYSAEGNSAKYDQLYALHQQASMSAEDVVNYEKLLAWLGPAVFDEPIEHPGTFDVAKDCKHYEYPTLELIGEVLNRENILPVVLLSSTYQSGTSKNLCKQRGYPASNRDEFMDCLIKVYTSDLETAGIKNFIVSSYNTPDDLVGQIVDKVDELSRDISCPDQTTVVPVPDTTEADSTEPEDVTTASDITSITSNTADSTEDNSSSSGAAESTQTGAGDESSTTGTNVPPVVPPVTPSGGHSSNTGVIAGASGGAAAGAAALGGLLYKKFGAGLLGHSTPGDLNVGEQVETPETPVEREAFEEVTTDMFQ